MDPVYYLPRTTCRNFECLSNLNMNDPLFRGNLYMFRCSKLSWNRMFEHERDMCNEDICPILSAWNDTEFFLGGLS